MSPSQVASNILSARYLRKGERTYEDICHRVASALADDEAERDRFFEAMISLKFLPNSPTLMGDYLEYALASGKITGEMPHMAMLFV